MNDINTAVVMVCVIALIVCAAAAIQYIKYRKAVDRLRRMISSAIDGTFSEECFDESVYSSIENDLAEYLLHSAKLMENIENEKNKIKTLISDISHQTKTTIANIMLYSELMEENAMSREEEEQLLTLKKQVKKLSFLISSLVKLSRLETGIISLAPKRGNVMSLVEKTVSSFISKAELKGLSLMAQADGEVMALFDEKWTLEAIGNIVDNAIKYTEKGTVVIEANRFEMFVSISVKDTGPGIEENEIPKIFSRFYRGEDMKNEEGVGIGLYLAREIISGEGGYIKVTSEKGRGAVFSVFLPVN